MTDVTRILSQMSAGDPHAANELLPLVYDELRKLAAAKLAHEKPGQTLQATALVHEAYLRLAGPAGRSQKSEVGGQRSAECGPASDLRSPTSDLDPPTPDSRSPSPLTFDSRGHFFAAAAEAMRRILVDAARRKQAAKRGGGALPLLADVADPLAIDGQLDLVALDEALTKFADKEPLKAQLVKLRFFAGQTMPQTAEILGISLATAERYWTFARAWLFAELAGDGSPARKMAKN